MTDGHAFRRQLGEPGDRLREEVALGCRVCDGPLEDHDWFVYDEDHPTIDAICTLAPVAEMLKWLTP